MLAYCWPRVADTGTTLRQHWINNSNLLGTCSYKYMILMIIKPMVVVLYTLVKCVINEMRALESIQRTGTRYILHYPDVKYSKRCTTPNLLPLSFWRDCADLIFFFKCLHELYAVQLDDFLDTNLHDKSLRSTSANCIFRPRLSKTTSFRQSYFNRVVPLWYNLPQDIRSSESLYVFKSRLYCYFDNLLCDFDVNNKCSWSGTCKYYTCMCNLPFFAR